MFATEDTIVAIASPPGGAIRGIVRISGERTLAILRELCEPSDWPGKVAWRHATTIDLGSPLGKVNASILLWPDDRSYVGMPSAEIHLPGAMPILESAVQRLIDAGARLAQPGEFTMRAFLAGRLDLTQAEAVLGVIDADDKQGLDAALRQLSGGLSQPLTALRTELLNLLAHLEAGLDFVEEDIEFISATDLLAGLRRIEHQIAEIAEQMDYRGAATGPPKVVLRGEPNAGKSSLINRLVDREISIVSHQAGTTRDCVEQAVEIDGIVLQLIDTAGVEPIPCVVRKDALALAEANHLTSDHATLNDDAISHHAQQLANRAAEEAELLLICVDVSTGALEPWQIEFQNAVPSKLRTVRFVATKADLCERLPPWVQDDWIVTSSVRGTGIDDLKAEIVRALQSFDRVESSTVSATAIRCRETLVAAVASLRQAVAIVESNLGEELVAAELRHALDAIGQVTGAVYTDDILDRIFSEFCIGK
ncbi:MAG: tRNA modification GTPase [Pirellulaceae bacterium]